MGALPRAGEFSPFPKGVGRGLEAAETTPPHIDPCSFTATQGFSPLPKLKISRYQGQVVRDKAQCPSCAPLDPQPQSSQECSPVPGLPCSATLHAGHNILLAVTPSAGSDFSSEILWEFQYFQALQVLQAIWHFQGALRPCLLLFLQKTNRKCPQPNSSVHGLSWSWFTQRQKLMQQYPCALCLGKEIVHWISFSYTKCKFLVKVHLWLNILISYN